MRSNSKPRSILVSKTSGHTLENEPYWVERGAEADPCQPRNGLCARYHTRVDRWKRGCLLGFASAVTATLIIWRRLYLTISLLDFPACLSALGAPPATTWPSTRPLDQYQHNQKLHFNVYREYIFFSLTSPLVCHFSFPSRNFMSKGNRPFEAFYACPNKQGSFFCFHWLSIKPFDTLFSILHYIITHSILILVDCCTLCWHCCCLYCHCSRTLCPLKKN